MTRVLVLTTEPLPVPGQPTTGAGLRAWGLTQGLRAAGLDASVLMPRDAVSTYTTEATRNSQLANSQTPNSQDWVGTFEWESLDATVVERAPDVIVLQHWGIANRLREVDCPLAIDLAGPHLLERRLWGSTDPEADLREKLDALRRTDFLCASGQFQRHYFLPYLAMAGWPIETGDPLPVIPFSMQPAPEPAPARHDRLIYGGFFLPWQDPAATLEIALEAIEHVGCGELLFIGGAHPRLDVSRGRFDELVERLKDHPAVRMVEPMAFDRYLALLAEGGVALDLMARNAERELAYTTRTVAYLAAGLPVIHDDYSELSEVIRKAGAGWTLDPDDRAGLKKLLTGLLRGEVEVATPARAAHELVKRDLDWERTITPLAEFCHNPAFRPGKTGARLAFEEQGRRLRGLEDELADATSDLATLRGKRWVRWGLGITSGKSWLRWPMAAVAIAFGIALIPVFWINDCIVGRFGPKRHERQ